jgi:multidrug efflux pump subunit AcrA (membrane-fusion protein)
MEIRRGHKTNEHPSSNPFLSSDPPHWAARGTTYLLALVFATLVIGAVVVQVPETISAKFVLAPRQGADPVRAMRRGVVRQVSVVEGQKVAKGESLFIIRSEQTGDQTAELQSLDARIRSANESLGIAREKDQSEQLSAAEERRKLQGRIEHLQRMIELKTGELAMAREVADSYAELRREGLASATVIKDRQAEVSRLTGQIEQLRDEDRNTRAAIEKLAHDEASRWNGYRERERQLKEGIETAKIRIAARSPWAAQSQGAEFVVAAPCSGAILRLQIKADGAIVGEGESLCELSCDEARLQAELQIPQSGAGRIRTGQGVKLLYDSFPYQQFGVKFGALRWISPTASTPEFRGIVDLEDDSIMVLGQAAPLKAGMGGRAEVVIGRRSLISIAFDPIRQLRENMVSPPERKPEAPAGGRR